MEILLVTPMSHTHYVVPPVGLGYLATALRQSGFNDIAILDCVKENYNLLDFKNYISENQPRVIGFQVFSCDFINVLNCVELVREVNPETIIILGGVHVTVTKQKILADVKPADFAFIGEAEIGLPLLLKRILNDEKIDYKNIPGLIWRTDSEVIANERIFIDDLDAIGFPAWDLIPPDKYPDNPQGAFYKNFPIAPISTSRGCPYKCTYCASFTNMGRINRTRNIQKVLDEMEFLIDNYGIKEFHIIDDVFNLNKNRVKEFCEGIKEREINISYTFPNGIRLDTLDEEVLSWMKETGAYAFTVGIESGSQRILDHMQKSLTLGLIEEKINLINKIGLEPSGFFILGYPEETREDIEKTIQFAKKLKIKRAHFSNFLPLPGTEATRKLLNTGEISEVDPADLFYSKVPYAPKTITKQELKKLQRKAYLSFYLRPKVLFKLLSEINSYNHLKSICRRSLDYLFKG